MRSGLGTRIFLLAILPPMLITTILVGYLIYSRVHDIHDQMAERGETVARQLAPALREPLAQNSTADLQRIAAAARVDPAVAAVTIQRGDGRVLVRTSDDEPHPSRQSTMVRIGTWLLNLDATPGFRVPIVQSPAPLLDRLPLDRGAPPLGWVLVDVDAAPQLHREAVFAVRALTALLLITLVSGALGYLAQRAVTRPVQMLTETVRRLGAGDRRARVHLLASGEIGTLARAVNRMAIRQERNEKDLNEQIEQATRELRETLEAVEIQNVELDIARKRALEGSKVKSEFLANMSHEIRTPINGILGFTDLLSHSQLNEEQRDYVATIRESGTNLLSLVNDILDFSKIEAGKLVIDNVAFDIRDCIEEVLSLMAPTAYGKSLELTHLEYQDVPFHLFGDPIRIRQVLTNLVHNAIKFTPQGRVVVRVMLEEESEERATIRIAVSDTGIGMKPEEQQKLFQAFSQADTSITRRFGGAGLGLIICKKLVEQMGGTVALESEADRGSTFWFTLDCVKQPSNDRGHRPLIRRNPLESRQVLLHDSSQLSRLGCRHMLESWGMEIHEADDLQALLSRWVARGRWDCIVIGLSRDELNRRYLRDILAAAGSPDAPLVVLASTVDRNELRSLYHQGAQICLPKAVRRQTLYRELCRVLTAERTPLGSGATQFTQPHQDIEASAGPSTPPADVVTDSSTRVLVVDDNAINRKLVSTILRRHGARVDEAIDGQDAVNLYSSTPFSLVFMDIHMPVLSGEEAFRAIRQIAEESGSTPPRVVALTANAMGGEKERLVGLGMDDCLIKPVTESQVLRQLQLTGSSPRGTDKTDSTTDGTVQQEMAGDMRAMLIAELPYHRKAIRDAFRRGELLALREHVHKLNGAARVCRAARLQEACDRLERTVAEERRVDIPGGVEHVIAAINELMPAHRQSG